MRKKSCQRLILALIITASPLSAHSFPASLSPRSAQAHLSFQILLPSAPRHKPTLCIHSPTDQLLCLKPLYSCLPEFSPVWSLACCLDSTLQPDRLSDNFVLSPRLAWVWLSACFWPRLNFSESVYDFCVSVSPASGSLLCSLYINMIKSMSLFSNYRGKMSMLKNLSAEYGGNSRG